MKTEIRFDPNVSKWVVAIQADSLPFWPAPWRFAGETHLVGGVAMFEVKHFDHKSDALAWIELKELPKPVDAPVELPAVVRFLRRA